MNTWLAKIRSHFKALNYLAPSAPLFQVKSIVRLNALVLRLSFLSDLATGVKPLYPDFTTNRDLKIWILL